VPVRYLTLAVVLAGGALVPLQAQADRKPPYLPTPNFQSLSVKDGLPRELVNAVTQDKNGFMWLGTPSGLVRYDGTRMLLFSKEAPRARRLTDSTITALHADPKGNVWVGTASGGLHRIDATTLAVEVIREKEGLSGDSISAIASGPAPDEIWVGTSRGLSHLDTAGKVRKIYRHADTEENSLVDDSILALYVEPDQLWVGTVAGLDRLDLKESKFVHYQKRLIAAGAVTSIARDGADNLWVGTYSGLFRLNADLVTMHYHDDNDATTISSDKIRTLLVDRLGALWIATEEKGINRFDREMNGFVRMLEDEWINCLFQDREGTVWIGRQGYGLARLAPASFQNYTNPSAAGKGTHTVWDIWQVYQDKRGVIWIAAGRGSGGLYRVDRKSRDVVHLAYDPKNPEGLSSNEVTRLAATPDGELWLGTYGGGLDRFDPKTMKVVKVYKNDPDSRTSLNSDNVSALGVDRAGRLWVGTTDAGLAWYDGKRDEFVRYVIDGAGNDAVFAIVPDPDEPEMLWVGTSAGVVRADTKNPKNTHVYAANPDDPAALSDKEVASMFLDDKKRLWVATLNGGLNLMDTKAGTFKRYGVAEGLPSMTVNCVVTDLAGHAWIGTPAGLSRFEPDSGKLTNFDSTDGIAPGEWVDGGCSRDDSSGELFFASNNGFTLFRPEDIVLDTEPPRTVITRLRRFNEDVLAEKAQSAFSYRDSLTIDFAVLSYTGKSTAAYMLEGLDREWTPAGASYSVTYNRLPPGNYKFKVKGANRHGVQSEIAAALDLRIPPPPWQTWWAYTSYAAAGIILISGSIIGQRRRVQRLKERVHLAEAQVKITQMENDLTLAAAAQSWFLPKDSVIRTPRIDVCGFYRPASRCGGDWWWYEPIDTHTTLLLVGDVTGHGAAPAVMTAAVATTLRASGRDTRAHDVEWRLKSLHSEIRDVCNGIFQMTITAVTLHEKEGVARVLSAGGVPLLRVAGDGMIRAIVCPGDPLGGRDLHLGRHEFELTPGDRLFLYTDGLTELRMANGKMMGAKRLSKLVQEARSLPLEKAVEAVEAEALRQLGGAEQEDDITMVAAEWKGIVEGDTTLAQRTKVRT
jgi:ligand-binding sensor domain-containing protein/serine phosphatase RsbU (regulator of sigma subunit)